jgi:hypothetical protein
LVLSGLVCSGANLPHTPNRGILTAEAIVGLDLRRMNLAVLSACESGLGESAGGEGVYGLVRAFHIAGTRNVAASLWKVDDEATAALMVLFYRHLWGKKPLPPAEALRQAQLAIYRNPQHVKEWSLGRGRQRPRRRGRPSSCRDREIDPSRSPGQESGNKMGLPAHQGQTAPLASEGSLRHNLEGGRLTGPPGKVAGHFYDFVAFFLAVDGFFTVSWQRSSLTPISPTSLSPISPRHSWRQGYDQRRREIMDVMRLGEGTKEMAEESGLPPGRISQMRREFEAAWRSFCRE